MCVCVCVCLFVCVCVCVNYPRLRECAFALLTVAVHSDSSIVARDSREMRQGVYNKVGESPITDHRSPITNFSDPVRTLMRTHEDTYIEVCGHI